MKALKEADKNGTVTAADTKVEETVIELIAFCPAQCQKVTFRSLLDNGGFFFRGVTRRGTGQSGRLGESGEGE